MKKKNTNKGTDTNTEQKYKIPIITAKDARIRVIKDFLIFTVPILILLMIFRFVFIIGVVPSESMYPLMNTDSGIIANRITYNFIEPSRGDVIIFRNGSVYMTKRIIGVPGDKVSIQNGIVYINEQPLIETYLAPDVKTLPLNGRNYFEVPEDSYFVLGDNRENSNDSRAWDDPYVPLSHITGKVLCVFSINPFSHGFYYRGVTEITVEPTYSGAPAYDPENIITETTEAAAGSDSLSTDLNTAATLPVETISPEDITEPVTEEETSEESSEDVESEESSAESETETSAETE